jgi:hypothetical protein
VGSVVGIVEKVAGYLGISGTMGMSGMRVIVDTLD